MEKLIQQSIDTQTSTTGMTQDSVNAYNAKLTAARDKIKSIKYKQVHQQ